jgi:putative FmdB family regulatory protein
MAQMGTADAGASLVRLVPIYEYKCPQGHVFELFQRMSDPPPEACEICGASPVERVLYPVAVHFKGSGFYSTDYGRGGRKREAASDDGSPPSTSTSKDGGGSDGGAAPEKKKPAEA